MVTYGTNPGMGIPVTGCIPDPDAMADPSTKAGLCKALDYMGFVPGQPILGQRLDAVFIGSCTNARLSDLRTAASILKGKKVARGLRVLVVPGSRAVKSAAESEGLDRVFREAGAEWREPGCSMCIAMNGDEVGPGQYCLSTSNRNFEGRQGKGARTLLASPATAAASAVAGAVGDQPGAGSIVVGRVVHVHITDRVLIGAGKIDLAQLKPIGRLAGSAYCRVVDVFDLPRPPSQIK